MLNMPWFESGGSPGPSGKIRIRSELRPRVDEAGHVTYVFTDPPLAGAPVPVTLRQATDERPEIVATVQGDGEETYVFTILESNTAATPLPE